MVISDVHGFLLITLSPLLSLDHVVGGCSAQATLTESFISWVPRRFWVSVGALSELSAQPVFSGGLGGLPSASFVRGTQILCSFSSAVQSNIHIKARSLFIPLNPTKLEFTLKDSESAGILACYNLLEEALLAGSNLCNTFVTSSLSPRGSGEKVMDL